MTPSAPLQELHAFYDSLPSGICLLSTDGREQILFASQGLLSLYACRTQEEFQALTGSRFRDMVDPEDYRPLEIVSHPSNNPLARTQGPIHPFLTFRIRTREGHYRRVEGILGKEDVPQLGTVWILSLISTSQKMLELKRDPITGLMGIHTFFQAAFCLGSRKKQEGQLKTFCPVYLNLTNFKLYNATWGIQAGDNLLRTIGAVLQSHFPTQLLTRLTGDGFVLLAAAQGLEEKLLDAVRQVNQLIGNPNIQLKAGIYPPQENDSPQDLRQSFDMAKSACDSIKKDALQAVAFYTPELGARLEIRSFVIEHFAQALQAGHIQVYYQPVIRSLTGKLCGMEALARWIDPERGMISPGVFVPILEEARLIHQLDQFVLNQSARLLRDLRSSHQPLIPISVNFSRIDFLVSNPFQLVEKAVRKYGLQRGYIRIEVTESALIHQSGPILQTLQKFHTSGYKLWMDDFGSAYSSLNLLHNYHFDLIKIDQAFLRNLNARGKKIITSIILMAKSLGIHTLAEGVETREQLEFLREVGCEKIQGFYFSRPQPYEALMTHLKSRHIPGETGLEDQCYEQLGLQNVVTDLPLGLFRYNQKALTLIFINQAYLRVLRSVGIHSLEEANQVHRDPAYPPGSRIRAYLDQLVAGRSVSPIVFVQNGQYLRLKARKITGTTPCYLGTAELQNITWDKKAPASQQQLDSHFRNLLTTYDSLLELDLDRDTVELLQNTNPSLDGSRVYHDIAAFFETYADRFVYPEDRTRFLQFLRPDNIQQQASHSDHGETADLFRLLRSEGEYRWFVFHGVLPYKSSGRKLLLGIQEECWEQKDPSVRRRELPQFARSLGIPLEASPRDESAYQVLFWNSIRTSPLKFFWKDRQLRFKGASRSFLDFYGLEEKDILGRTDEELGWHPAPDPYRKDEEDVLLQGRTITRHLGTCIVRGVPHTILSSKFPLYRNNQIVGILGYFDDLEDTPAQQALLRELNLRDPETGFLSYRGMLETGLQYADAWRCRKEDYAACLLDIPEFDEFRQAYGMELGRKLLDKITEKLRNLGLKAISLSRIGSCCFLAFTKALILKELDGQIQLLARRIHAITQVEGYPCTLYLQYALARGSECQNLDNLLSLLTERLKEAREERYGESIFIGDRIVFDREKFDNMDELVMISDPETHEMVYMNKVAQQAYHLKGPQDYEGRSCHEVLEAQKTPCADCPVPILRQDKFHVVTHHSLKAGLDLLVRDTLVPWRGRALHFVMALNLNQYVDMDIARNELIFREAAANDVIALGLREEDPNQGIRKMMAQIGQNMKADRFYIFEENPDGTISATYEWYREGLAPHLDQLQNLPKKVAQPLYDTFDKEQIALVPDMQALLDRYHGFHPHIPDLHSVVSGHLTQGGRSLGFTEVVNPSADTFHSASLLLATLTRFFAILLRNRNSRRILEHNSRTDPLTGAGNRYAFHAAIAALPEGVDLAFVFGDINGLKRVNDTRGHEAGDQLICTAAEVMGQLKGSGKVFRMGGDEFLLLKEIASPGDAEALTKALKDRYKALGVSMALGTVTCRTPLANVDQIITQVDRKMYQDKGVMYGRRSTDK